jgi:DNA-directed RNA polymerase subunit RPC12/RpoP
MERVYTFLDDRMFTYRCININCKENHRVKGWTQWINCEACGADALPTEVLYRCLKCGALEAFSQEKNGVSCRSCGFRIFVKPRRSGTDPEQGGEGAYKILKAD